MSGLTDCRDCGQKVSTRAAACPGCGGPMDGHVSVTTQRTSKSLKIWHLIWMLLLAAGMGVPALAGLSGHPAVLTVGGILIAAGFLGWVTQGVRIWWQHE